MAANSAVEAGSGEMLVEAAIRLLREMALEGGLSNLKKLAEFGRECVEKSAEAP